MYEDIKKKIEKTKYKVEI